MKTPIGVEVGRLIRDRVLAAQFLFDSGKRVCDVFHLVGEKGSSPGGIGQFVQNLVSAQNQPAIVGGDGINKDLGALRHLDRLSAAVFALVIFAIAQYYDCFANGTFGAFTQ